VNREKQFEARDLSSSEYVLALHAPEDPIAVLLRNRSRNQTLQRITSAEAIASPEFQKWLKRENRSGSDVFVGMNPLKEGSTSRFKENIREIRHVYLDLDEDAPTALARVRESSDVPPPNFVLDTSREKHQVVWKIEGADLEQAETLLRSLASEFGGDTAATDATRVLRMPGFTNRKYADDFSVHAHYESEHVHSLRDFALRDGSAGFSRDYEGTRSSRRLPAGHKSQSEADWAYARRALARGDDAQEIIRRIADYRADDKHDPIYYARLTVIKAQLSMMTPNTAQTAVPDKVPATKPDR
jgi:RepB DNA-primase from phage plasmid